MVSHDVEKVLSAVRSLLLSSVECEDCPVIDLYEQIYNSIKEQSDAEILRSLDFHLPSKKCRGGTF